MPKPAHVCTKVCLHRITGYPDIQKPQAFRLVHSWAKFYTKEETRQKCLNPEAVDVEANSSAVTGINTEYTPVT